MDTISSWLGKIRSFLPIPLQVVTAPLSEPATVMDPESEDYQKWTDQLPAAKKPVGWQEKGLEVPQISPDDLIPAKLPTKAIPLIGGMFIGKEAPIFNMKKAIEASRLQGLGHSPRDIYTQLQTFVAHPDKAVRQEISDAEAHFFPEMLRPVYLDPDVEHSTVKRMDKLFNHPKLYEGYPFLKDYLVEVKTGAGVRTDGVHYDKLKMMKIAGSTQDDLLSTILHEIQHAIQRKEKWAPGGSPDFIPYMNEFKRLYKEHTQRYFDMGLTEQSAKEQAAFDIYEKLAGEAESRVTQARRKWSPEVLRRFYPGDTYDLITPLDQLLISPR